MTIFFSVLSAILVVWLIWSTISDYNASPDSGLLAAFRGSVTMIWAKLLSLAAALLGVIEYSADALNLPQVSEAIKAYVPPEAIPAIFALIGVITLFTRMRTARRD